MLEVESKKMPGNALVEGELERVLAHVSRETAAALRPFLERALLQPVFDVLARQGKKLRAQLVDLGFDLLAAEGHSPDLRVRETCMAVLECLHAGSLIIDDIEDGSLSRRGKPTLHRQYGLSTALNAGNWMYFEPLERVRALRLAPERELAIYRAYHRALVSAHLGQSIDVGVAVDGVPRGQVEALCRASIELKSGKLTALSLVLAAHALGANQTQIEALDRFGTQFGTALQMFDDLGNLLGRRDLEKRWEDLKLRRPSWVWACLARSLSVEEYETFKQAVQALPVVQPLDTWLSTHSDWIQTSLNEVRSSLENAITDLKAAFPQSQMQAWRRLKDIKDSLVGAYV